MKREISLSSLPFLTREFLIRYRIKKNQPHEDTVCLCEIEEILEGSPAHFRDTSFTGGIHFDNIIDLRELKIGYDGEQRIEIATYYLNSYIKERVMKA